MENGFRMPDSVAFGWGAQKISEQFAGSGVDAEILAHLDRDSEAVSRLSVRGVLPRSEAKKAYRRIQKRLENDLLKVRA